MRKPRHLSPEERALWERVARQTERLHPMSKTAASERRPAGKMAKKVSDPAKPCSVPAFRIGEKAMSTAPVPADKPARLAMDHKTFRKMKGGKLAPEARLDLHGHTLEQAHPRLAGFIETSARRGLRLVLVITGKGRSCRDDGLFHSQPGVLRRQVPHWLHTMPAVLQITEASRKHGGEGALYVYLRRRRS